MPERQLVTLTDGEGTTAVIAPELGGWLLRYARETPKHGIVEALHFSQAVVDRYPREMYAGIPVLFPLVSNNLAGDKEHHYEWNGQTFEMPQHGFARRSKWNVVEQTATSVTMVKGCPRGGPANTAPNLRMMPSANSRFNRRFTAAADRCTLSPNSAWERRQSCCTNSSKCRSMLSSAEVSIACAQKHCVWGGKNARPFRRYLNTIAHDDDLHPEVTGARTMPCRIVGVRFVRGTSLDLGNP